MNKILKKTIAALLMSPFAFFMTLAVGGFLIALYKFIMFLLVPPPVILLLAGIPIAVIGLSVLGCHMFIKGEKMWQEANKQDKPEEPPELDDQGRIKKWRNRDRFFAQGCPDCGNKDFLEGPSGGLCVNFKCNKCGSTFNDMGPFGIERIGNRF